MANYQTGRQIRVAYGVETSFGVAAAADLATAKTFRANSGAINLTKKTSSSGENRADGMMTRARHGQREVKGSYVADLSHGTFDDLIEAVMRGTWTADLTITAATPALSSATLSVGAHTITASAGSWITAGLRVGQVIILGDGFGPTNLVGIMLHITGLTATVITVAETLTVEAGPLASYTVFAGKSLLQGVTRRSFSVEEAELDVDGSELFTGCRVSKMALDVKPNNNATVTFDFAGQNMTVKEGADSPYFTDNATTTSLGLACADMAILFNGDAIVDLTSCSLSVDLSAAGTDVVGSTITPDVFENLAKVTAKISGLRHDFSKVKNFLAEDQLSLHLLFVDPVFHQYISIFVGNLTLGTASKSQLGKDGPRTQDFDLLIGKDERGGAYAPTMLLIQTDAA